MVGLLSPSDYAGYADEGRRLAVDVPNVTPMDAACFIAEATPIIGDAMAAKEIYDDPNFNAKVDEQKWWYESLVAEFRKSKIAPDLVDRLDRAVKAIFN